MYKKLFIGILVTLLASSAVAQETSLADREVTRAILISEFSQDPRALAIAQTRAWAARQNMSGSGLDNFVAEYSRTYDEQVAIRNTGQLPMSVNDRAFRDLTKWALQRTIEIYAPGSGGAVDILLGAAEQHMENYVASDAVDFAGEYLADRKYEAVVNVERLTDYILNTPGIRSGLVQDIGVDIDKSANEQFLQFPDVANVFLNHELVTGVQSNGRTLMQIMESIDTLDQNDEARRQELMSELLSHMEDGFGLLGSQIEEGVLSLAEQQQLRFDELDRRTEEIAGEIGINRTILMAYIEDQQAREMERQAREEAARQAAAEAAQLRSYLQAGAFLLNAIEPGYGDQFAVFANSSIQIRDAIKAFQAAESVDFGSVASLASGIANPALAIFSVMQATGPSSDQMILDQLAMIAMQIAELREEMNARFDIVDAKLDRVFLEVSSGLSLVSQKLDINLEAIATNLQVGLDSQTLLLAESQKLAEAIRDTVLVPCIDRASTLPLPDESFINCVSQLHNYATNGIEREQVTWDSTYSPETLANLLRATDGRTTDVLNNVFANRSSALLPAEIIAAMSSWLTTANWYHDFLVENLDQTKRTAILSRFDSLADRGRRVLTLRSAVLESLDNYPDTGSPDVLPTPGTDYHAAVDFIDRGRRIVDDVRAMVDLRASEYFDEQGFFLYNIDLDFDELDGAGSFFPEYRPGSRSFDTGASRGRIEPQMVELLPETLRAAVLNGMGSLSLHVAYVNSHLVERNCGFLDLERRVFARFDRYVARLYFDAAQGVGLPSQEVVTVNFRYPLTDGSVSAGCGGFLPAGPKYCNSPDCLGQGAEAALPAASVNAVPETLLREKWALHRNTIADSILAALDSPDRESSIRLENALFSAIVRFALSNTLASNDGLFAIANGRVALPDPGGFAERLRAVRNRDGEAVALPIVWQVSDYLDDELLALHDFFSSGALDRAVAREQVSVEVEAMLSKLNNADLLLQIYQPESAAPPPTTTPPQQPPPASGGESQGAPSGGGGSVDLLWVIILLWHCLRTISVGTLSGNKRPRSVGTLVG